MNRRRLKILRDLMLDIASRRGKSKAGVGHDQSSYYYAEASIRPINPQLKLDEKTGACSIEVNELDEPSVCSTAACALGHAALHPPFMRAGLKLKFNIHEVTFDDRHHIRGSVFYKRYRDGEAGRAFFGITINQRDYLFGDTGEDAKGVARRIDEVLAGKIL